MVFFLTFIIVSVLLVQLRIVGIFCLCVCFSFSFCFLFFIHLSQSCRANLMRQRFLTTMFPGGRASHLIDLKRQQSSPLLKMRQLLGLLKSLILRYISSQTLITILALCLHLLLLSYRHILVTHQKTVTISISVPPNRLIPPSKLGSFSYQSHFFLGSEHQVCRRRGQRVLQIFQKNFRSPGDHRSNYFMAQ